MEFTTTNFILIVSVLFATIFYWSRRRPKNYPPGPWRLPFIGNAHQVGKQPYLDFMKMREKYGDIIAIDFGSYRSVIINDYKLIREALNETAFTGRPRLEFMLERSGGTPAGVIFTDGQQWVEQRRFILKNLRDFGFGKKSMEGFVQQEIEELIETFKKDVGKPMTTQGKFNAAVLNALWAIVTGQRHSHDDPILGDLIKRLTSGIQQSRALGIGLFMPWLKKIAPKLVGMDPKRSRDNREKTMKFMTDSIKGHQSTFQENSPRDFIDVYLAEIQRTTDVGSSFHAKEGERNLSVVMLDLFVAGAETTSTTLTWTFLLMAMHPEIQEKLFAEIKRIVGMSRLPSLSDRPLMPYTEAVIMEVMRYSAMVPLAVQHRTTEDVNFHGYFIPADTLVVPNLYCAMRDPKVWGDADNFRPERFLSPDEKTVIRHDALIPFSTGKRVCLGETLARDELFLFTTSLFQRFRVGGDPNGPPLKPDYYMAAVLIPKPHNLVLADRFEEL
jgi:cytochrome P450 family 2 subfamily J